MKRLIQVLLSFILAGVLTGCLRDCCCVCDRAMREGRGSMMSRAVSERDRWYLTARSKETLERIDRGDQLAVRDVIHMHQAGMLPEDIVRILKATRSETQWERRELLGLQALGVSSTVLQNISTIPAQDVADTPQTPSNRAR